MTISQPRSLVLGLSLALAACGGEGLILPPDGAPAHIEVMSGNGQSGRVGSTLAESLVVNVTDTEDRAVAGANVVFEFTANGSAASPATATTDGDGRAASRLVLGTRVGPVAGVVRVPVEAGVTPVEAAITAIALSDNANGIALVSGNDQTGPVGSELSAPLVVAVTDAFGNPISGVTVEWSVTGGGSVSVTTTQTGPNGQASVTRTLGPTAGPQTAVATATGLAGSPVTFTHTATAGTATGVVKVSGDNQSALVGTELANPLVLQVLDAQGNPIPNRAVTWVTGEGSVNPENTTTDAQGHASTRWTLGPTPGAKTANGVVSGVGTAIFNATATAGAPSASTSSVSASPVTINVGTGSSTITVTVRDAGNNPVGGVSVTPASSGSGNTFNPAVASTGGNGVATFSFSSTVAEAKTISANAGGVAITDQATVTVVKAASTTRITRDEPDRSISGETVRVEFTVTGSGGTPTGTVTITASGGTATETCSAPVATGQCDVVLVILGNPRVLTATYSGDDRFNGSTDAENHRVDPAPVANNPPTAAFTAPSCTTNQPCQFNDQSTDSDGTVASRLWEFGDGETSTIENPSHTYTTAGPKSVKLTVTDDDGAANSVTHEVTVSDPPPVNSAPTANNDAYSTPGLGQPLVVSDPSQGVLANDSDPDIGDVLSAQNASDPPQGSLSMNSDGIFTYTPDPGASGEDSFTYQASDGSATSQATVTITINP